MRTDKDAHVTEFMDDLAELMGEWQTKVQLTNLNMAVHDHRTFEEASKIIEETKKPFRDQDL